MNDRAIISVRTSVSITTEFSITIDLYQGSTLSSYLFALEMDESTKSVQEKVP